LNVKKKIKQKMTSTQQPTSKILNVTLGKMSAELHIFDKEKTTKEIVEQIFTTSLVPATENPIFIMELSSIVRKYQDWTKNLPKVVPYYAVKCNDEPILLRVLARLGTGFDCASQAEIALVMDIPGVDKNRIIFANPCKPKSHLTYAKTRGVNRMTFDSDTELKKIMLVYPEAEVILRLRVDDSGATSRLGMKFGAEEEDVDDLLEYAKTKGANLMGLSFHVGSGQQSPTAFVDALELVHDVKEKANKLGFKIKVLDIGGGFPGSDSKKLQFPTLAKTIEKKIGELFGDVEEVIAEPGRFFGAPCGTLVTSVTAKKVSKDKKSIMYYVNDGVYGSLNNVLMDHYVPVPLTLKTKEEGFSSNCTLFGPTCDSLDCIMSNIELPNLEEDDCVYFENMGAYSICAASNFNGFAFPSVVYIWRCNDEFNYDFLLNAD